MTQIAQATKVAQAVQNNAQWCDLICRLHGAPGEFSAQLWLNRHQTPRFYPNAVTLAPPQPGTPEEQQLYALLESALPAHGAVKDSFCTLDLAPLGYTQLFVAQWIWRDPTLPRPVSQTYTRWGAVEDEQTLAQWEAAWNGQPPAAETTVAPRVFLPALLVDPTVSVIAAYEDEQIVGGVIANESGRVVGVSNLFYPDQGVHQYWAGGVAVIMERYPGLPLVGYKRGDDLAAAQLLGFEAVGPLQVWAR